MCIGEAMILRQLKEEGGFESYAHERDARMRARLATVRANVF